MQIAPAEYDTTMPPAAWHPKTRRVHDYWRKIHPEKNLPGRQHFDPLDIADLMPQIWLVDVHHAPMRLRYRLVGTKATAIFREELTGCWFHEAHPEFVPGAAHYADYAFVAESGQPICSRGKPILNYEPNFTKRERLILPLARDGRHVDMMLCMMVIFGRDGREAL